MDDERYFTEFFETLKAKTRSWIQSIGRHTHLGPYDLSSGLGNYIYYMHLPLRDTYCGMRKSGISSSEAIDRLVDLKMPSEIDLSDDAITSEPELNDCARQWEAMLQPLKGSKVYYANSSRMAEYLLPFLRREKDGATLVTESEIRHDALDLPSGITVLKFVDSGCRLYRNKFLERYVPRFFSHASTLLLLDHLLQPEEFYCVCGCHTQSKIWAAAFNARGGTSVCYQHGWPAFMHAGFVDMPYTRMITWGDEFNRLWHKYNPQMECLTGGYPYPIEAEGSHHSVTFFLQEPYFVSSHRMVGQMYDLIVATALRYPDMTIQYRLHPESQIDSHIRHRLDSLPNVVDTTDRPLHEVYASTRVAVSHYSSTIMECLAHGCCPLVFNPTPRWRYTPDLEAESIGFISTTPDEFFDRLPRALAHRIAPTTVARWIAPPRCEPDS